MGRVQPTHPQEEGRRGRSGVNHSKLDLCPGVTPREPGKARVVGDAGACGKWGREHWEQGALQHGAKGKVFCALGTVDLSVEALQGAKSTARREVRCLAGVLDARAQGRVEAGSQK